MALPRCQQRPSAPSFPDHLPLTHLFPLFTVTARIDAKTGIDYSLVAAPRATAQSLDADLKGEFYSLAHRSTVPFSPLPLALPSDHDRMVYFGASSYFFNTAGIAYHEAGALVFEITEDMIPKDVGFSLDTSTFSAFIPQVSSLALPAQSSCTHRLCSVPGISLNPIVDAQAYAILPNSSLAPLFLLSLVRTIQSLMNILTSSSLLPRLNGENLLGRMGVLEHPTLRLLHPSGASSLIKSSLPRLIWGKSACRRLQ
uniref:Bactericidal permeability-increasing protein n=1 Tax=Corvus moneduloides TaxID=1196302 RepID=A0A8C3DMM7_CORMO